MRRLFRLLALVSIAGSAVLFACSKKSTPPTAPPQTDCTLDPATITFGTVLNGQSRDTTFKLTNTSSGQISGNVSLVSPDFQLASGAAYNLAPGRFARFTLRYAPSASGTHAATVTTDCGTLPLSGTDVTTTCEASPETLSFGRPDPGELLALTVKNTSMYSVSGTVSSSCPAFPLVGSASYQLGPGQSKQVQVGFEPTQAGPQSCTLGTGLPGCPTVVATGIGQACNVSPTALNLGTTWDHIDKTFTITNTDAFPLRGTVTASCPTVAILGPASYDLAPGSSQTFTVGLVNSGYGRHTCQIDPGVGTCSPVTVSDSTATLDPPEGPCAGPTERTVDLGTVAVGQSVTHVLRICGGGLCTPSSEYCNGFLLVMSNDLTFNDISFGGICGYTDCRSLTATFTPQEPGVHHVLVAVYSYDAGYSPTVAAYVEFRATVVPASGSW